jgi:DNA replication protein DnaC
LIDSFENHLIKNNVNFANLKKPFNTNQSEELIQMENMRKEALGVFSHFDVEKMLSSLSVKEKTEELSLRLKEMGEVEESAINSQVYQAVIDILEQMKKILEQLKKFADNFGKDTYRNYLFVGGTGLGKTHLSTSIAKKVIDNGNDVLYVTAVGMIGDYEAKRFGDGQGAGNDLSRYVDADLLIIDDLGTEVTNQFTLSVIYDVINNRINRRRSTIINTNLSASEIEGKYTERIYSRIFGEYIPILFKGTDIRRQKMRK